MTDKHTRTGRYLARPFVIAGLLSLIWGAAAASSVFPDWSATITLPPPVNTAYGAMIDLDDANNVYVAAYRPFGYFVTAKYSPSGNLLWQQTFSVAGKHFDATWLAVDPTGGGVVVTGVSRCCAGGYPDDVGLATPSIRTTAC
jgi:hypothetical protein